MTPLPICVAPHDGEFDKEESNKLTKWVGAETTRPPMIWGLDSSLCLPSGLCPHEEMIEEGMVKEKTSAVILNSEEYLKLGIIFI
jgi:hypothetical protein